MLVRHGPGAPEILLLKRHSRSVFGDVHVFPGGVVDPCDAMVGDCCGKVCDAAANSILGTDNALRFYSAAIRELFEETGVLLAHNTGNAKENAPNTLAAADTERHKLIQGEISWPGFLRDRDLQLASEALHYFAHWVTPGSEPKRFSTRFFMAAMPQGQDASHDGHELTDSRWMTADEVLEAKRRGHVRLIFPTWRTLRDIATFRSVEEITTWANERQKSGVARILPAIVEIDGKESVVLPGDPRYPAVRPA
jgi:8-oxo-dGTP pyrophosphatase MutT (NUDIX family)